ncbi:NAD(P)H-quinone oxidoreductase subunit L, chloroplastic isoform X2 [Macadamia integrifolia]|uniref:NAD(P)H-quinone oxidoreductase subunit L, chloroplastic isoform X2 n=1 Tax=Macadamia integrifolia TaxID=60698 RepID=UPI001C4FE025|nr:NAD(P)H-quinone oxidoreductase subunit L, chloroplastic isoform X2 [Macadamia integrifolia]
MNYSLSFPTPTVFPVCFSSNCRQPSLSIICQSKDKKKHKKVQCSICEKQINSSNLHKSGLAIQIGALLATIDQPAFAVTGVNNEEDLIWVLLQIGIIAFGYFLIVPPIIMNWLRLRWYKRNLLEMYLQFLSVFLFFPGRLPQDPSMKYPWSTPQDTSFNDPKSM